MEITKELKDKALTLLVEEYDKKRASTILSMFDNYYSPDLKEAFYSYVETGEIPNYEYDGKNFDYVMKKAHCSFFEAFPIFDSLMKDEEYRMIFDKMNFGKK